MNRKGTDRGAEMRLTERTRKLITEAVSKTIWAAVFCTRWSFATLDADQPNRSELALSKWERTIAVAMDPAMSSL